MPVGSVTKGGRVAIGRDCGASEGDGAGSFRGLPAHDPFDDPADMLFISLGRSRLAVPQVLPEILLGQGLISVGIESPRHCSLKVGSKLEATDPGLGVAQPETEFDPFTGKDTLGQQGEIQPAVLIGRRPEIMAIAAVGLGAEPGMTRLGTFGKGQPLAAAAKDQDDGQAVSHCQSSRAWPIVVRSVPNQIEWLSAS